jgi:hypothetical protein
MQNPKILNYPEMKVAMRKDFYEKFSAQLKQLQEDTGALLFSHTLIDDYKGPNHKVSTFNSDEEWHELYWDKFWNNDASENTCHQVANAYGSGIVSWQVADPDSDCMEARMRVGGVHDGLMIAFKHPSGLLENMSFGWEKGDNSTLALEKLGAITEIVEPIRQYHRQSYHSYI